MPGKSRINAPEALHHIIARGIERKAIFRDDQDRDSFLERLGNNVKESRAPCYVWALLRNHFYLLLRTGATSISTVMRRILRGYAIDFNSRHGREGHLFQNRSDSPDMLAPQGKRGGIQEFVTPRYRATPAPDYP